MPKILTPSRDRVITFRLPERLFVELAEAARKHDARSVSAFIRSVLVQQLSADETDRRLRAIYQRLEALEQRTPAERSV